VQLPLWQPESSWRPPALASLPSWKGAKRVGIDVETCDPLLRELGPGVRRGAYIVGYSFAIEDGPKHYLPVRHGGGDNLPPQQVEDYIRQQARSFDGIIVGANLSYDLDFMAQRDITFPAVQWFRDVLVAEPLIDALSDNYSLEGVANRRLGIGKNEVKLREAAADYRIDPKKGLHALPARFVGEYGADDAWLPLLILRKQEKDIEEQDLWRVFNTESRLLPVLLRMRRRGIRIDLDALDQVETWAWQQCDEALDVVHSHTGHRIHRQEVLNAARLAPALREAGVNVPTTSQGRPSIQKDWLKTLNHPVADAINRARRFNKVVTTFGASMRRYMVDGRIHCTLNQVRRQKDDEGADDEQGGGRFGRLSSEDPNMQQQPARDPEIGKRWRRIFLPEPGELWASNDYSQQEPRWTVHYADLVGLPRAEEAARRYRENPATDNHQMMADMIQGRPATKQERSHAKEIFLGLCYGMGGAKLCRKLGLPTAWAVFDPEMRGVRHAVDSERGRQLIAQGEKVWEVAGPEGQRLLDQYDREVPFVKKLAKRAERRAAAVGYVVTAGGRRCRFPKRPDGSFDWTHKALNRIIQGSSGDQTKESMVALDAEGFRLLLQVHDENCLSVRDRAEAEAAAEIMRNVIPMRVPMKCDVEVGLSWGEAA
jgi:DNA polymerase I-like protein with 3'-5' exonuclease and polymerase domains